MDTDTLDSVIDPSLQDPLPTHDDSSSIDPPPPQSDMVGDDSKPASPSAPKGKRKRKPFPPGSAADFKRKEANRLAAERSRSRASEKAKALSKAHAQLTAENEDLLAAINRFELLSHQGGASEAQEREKRALDEQMEAAIKAAQGHSDPGQQEQDRADRNILAALMAGDMFEEGDWGEAAATATAAGNEGIENLLKQADGSGRLGELAAVATVPGDKGEETSSKDDNANTAQSGEKKEVRSTEDVDISMEKLAEELKEGKVEPNPTPRLHDFTYNPSEASSATASAVAVVLNTEIERVVRDDVALTRVAIARLEKDIARAKGGDVPEDLEEDPPARLPEEVLSYDKEELARAMEVAEESREALEKGVEELQNRVKDEKEKKVGQEGQVAKGVQEMIRFAEKAEGAEKGKIMEVLKSVRGYIGNMIWGLEDDATDDTLLGTSFSTPAIARRRRGRPPKNTFPLRYNHASLIYPSIPIDSSSSTANLSPSTHTPRDPSSSQTPTAADQPPKVRKRRGVRGKRSTLSVVDSSTFDPPITSTTNAEEYIISHLQASTNATSANQPLLGEDGLPISHGSLIDPAFQSLEWTESVLSRLKKGGPGSCDICARTETSVWRKLVLGGEDYRVCNACGLYHRKFGVIRPPSLWGDGAEAVKKRQKIPGPDDGRRNRKVRKTTHGVDDPQTEAAEADQLADGTVDDGAEKSDEPIVGETEVDEAGILAIQQSLRDAGRELGLGLTEDNQVVEGGEGGHVDLDLSGFETLEEELRGQGIFPDLDDQEE